MAVVVRLEWPVGETAVLSSLLSALRAAKYPVKLIVELEVPDQAVVPEEHQHMTQQEIGRRLFGQK